MSSFFVWMLASGCASKGLYSSASVGPVRSDAEASVLVSGVIDSRMFGKPSDAAITNFKAEQRAAQFANLSSSVSAHLAAARVIGPYDTISAAPESEEEIESLLAEAVQEGIDEVWFVRLTEAHAYNNTALGIEIVNVLGTATIPLGGIGLVPLLIAYSVPVNKEGSGSAVEIIAVDPDTRELLAQESAALSFEREVAMFDLNAGRETMKTVRNNIDSLLREIVEQREEGFPKRTPSESLHSLILSGSPESEIAESEEISEL